MLKFKEIKEDHKNGYNYMEYQNRWVGYDATYIKEGDSLMIMLENEKTTCTARFDMIDFMNMSYKEFKKIICEWLFYNSEEKQKVLNENN